MEAINQLASLAYQSPLEANFVAELQNLPALGAFCSPKTRLAFLRDLEDLLRYFPFNTWEEVITFMFVGLELDSG